jgi:hypothetical protein
VAGAPLADDVGVSIELTSRAGYVDCPRRGEISVEWCLGCPYLLRLDHLDDGRTVVHCDADPDPLAGGHATDNPLHEVPALWS